MATYETYRKQGGTSTGTEDAVFNGGLFDTIKGITQDFVVSGFGTTTSSLVLTIATGVAYVSGRRIEIESSSVINATDNATSLIYLNRSGVFSSVASVTNAPENSSLIFTVVAASGAITSVTNNYNITPVSEGKIEDGSISTNKLADLSVTNDKIATSTIQSTKLVDSPVTSGTYKNPTVTIDEKGLVTNAVANTLKLNDLSDVSAGGFADGDYLRYNANSGMFTRANVLELAKEMTPLFPTKIVSRTITFEDVNTDSDASTTTQGIFTLPAGSCVKVVKFHHTEAFAVSTGTATNIYLHLTLGQGATNMPGATAYDAAVTSSDITGYLHYPSAGTALLDEGDDIRVDITCTINGGATTNNLNAGSVDVFVVYYNLGTVTSNTITGIY